MEFIINVIKLIGICVLLIGSFMIPIKMIYSRHKAIRLLGYMLFVVAVVAFYYGYYESGAGMIDREFIDTKGTAGVRQYNM